MAVSDEYLASVRHSVRLSSTAHDGELTDLINAARADLVLGGVLEEKANDEKDPLIKKAVTTYVKAEFGLDNEDADRLRASYKEQRNGLTLSDSYIGIRCIGGRQRHGGGAGISAAVDFERGIRGSNGKAYRRGGGLPAEGGIVPALDHEAIP